MATPNTPTPPPAGPPVDPALARQATQPQREEQPPVGAVIPPGLATAAAMSGAAPAEADMKAIIEQMQAQMAALTAKIAAMQAGQAPGGDHPLLATAKSAKDLLATHYQVNPGADGAAVLRLADDLVDAAGNAVDSGDTAAVRQLGDKFTRALNRAHPGAGDHHYFNQALQFVRDHLQDAADLVTEPAPKPAGAVGSDRPAAPVVAGSVTG
jgi:hypothetical protein